MTYSLLYLLWGQILGPRIITFLLRLLFDLGYRGLLFASTTNLGVRPRFAGICNSALVWLFIAFILHVNYGPFINVTKLFDIRCFKIYCSIVAVCVQWLSRDGYQHAHGGGGLTRWRGKTLEDLKNGHTSIGQSCVCYLDSKSQNLVT